MKTLRELSVFKKYVSHYVLATDSQRNAVAFYNQVKRATPKGWMCVLYPLKGGFVIDYLSAGYVGGVTYIRQFRDGHEVINES